MKGRKLSPKQERFCQEYMKDLNATQAAIRAGYSEKTADPQGPRLLGKVRIKERIAELQEKLQKKTDITVERVLNELSYIAFSRPTDIADWDGDSLMLKDSDELPENAVASISEISCRTTEKGSKIVSAKTHSKIQALSMLMDHLGMKKAPDNTDNIDRAASNIDKLTQDQLKALDDIQGTLGGA